MASIPKRDGSAAKTSLGNEGKDVTNPQHVDSIEKFESWLMTDEGFRRSGSETQSLYRMVLADTTFPVEGSASQALRERLVLPSLHLLVIFAMLWASFELVVFVIVAILTNIPAAIVAVAVSIPLAFRFADSMDVTFGRNRRGHEGYALPKLEEPFRFGSRACVAYPLIDRPSVSYDELIEPIILSAMNNNSVNIQHAVLLDLADSPTEESDGDQACVSLAMKAIRAANTRLPLTNDIVLLVRARTWSSGEKAWIGFERKRGKLADLISELVEGQQESGRFRWRTDWVRPADVLVTVDEGSVLALGAVEEMASVLLHPANEPIIEGGVVRAGFGALQPALGVTSGRQEYDRKIDGRFARYGVGTFVGQGALNTYVYNRVLSGVIPASQVLSHDKLEGYHLRTCRVESYLVADKAAVGYRSILRRNERWVRGDIQLLPWALGSSSQGRTRLPRLFQWWLWKDVIKVLEPLSAITLSAIAGTKPTAWWAQALGLLFAGLMYRSELVTLTRATRSSSSSLRLIRRAVRKWSNLLVDTCLHTTAAGVALIRLATHKHLLQWHPSAQRSVGIDKGTIALFAAFTLSAIGITVCINSNHATLAAAFAIWAIAPAVRLVRS